MSDEQIIKLWHMAGFITTPSGFALKKLRRFIEIVMELKHGN